MKLNYRTAALVAIAALSLGGASTLLSRRAVVHAGGKMAPKFEVDPFWPKPLPNHWILGQTIGLSVDAHDNVWITHRPGSLEAGEVHATTKPPISGCCAPAPPVLEFNAAGDLINYWGGPGAGYNWPASEHGIMADNKGNVWLGANGRRLGSKGSSTDEAPGPSRNFRDNMILKFTEDGKFVMQIGKPNQSKGSNDTENVKGAAQMFFDAKANEVYVADGYGNRRLIVFDAETGKYKRHWGAYGNKPDDTDDGPYKPTEPPSKQFRSPVHCVVISNDELVYVCDRENDRVQIFHKDGTFVKEFFVNKDTLGSGSTWEIAFSRDPQQKFLYLTDGENDRIHIFDRQSLEMLTTFGEGGRQPGMFYGVHSIGTDSKGNIYTAETYRGQRVQKFVYKGVQAVTSEDQRVLWPKNLANAPATTSK